MKKTATVFWDKGRYYFETDPETRHWRMSHMYRKAAELGFTHVSIVQAHKEDSGFVVDRMLPDGIGDSVECEPATRKIPSKYRGGKEGGA